jgi:general secretion pathway protein G
MEKRDCFSHQIKDDKGFTLIQLLIVVGIIAVLAGIALTRFNNALTKAKLNKAEAEIEMMGRAIEQIEEDTENYIKSLEQLDDTTSPVDPDDSFSPWWGPYLSSIPASLQDPWGTSYAYFFWTTEKERGKQFQMGNYPPGPPGKGWDKGEKKGWGDDSLPPGLWKKLTPEESLSGRGFLIVSAGPDKEIATEDDIEYGKY